MKKSILVIMLVVILSGGISYNYIQGLNQEVKVYLDGEELVFDTKPVKCL